MNRYVFEEPQSPPSTFIEYVLKRYRECGRLTKAISFPCLKCDGDGKIIDPNDPGDPVEGHKFSDRIACPRCHGSGENSEAEYEAHYQSLLRQYHVTINNIMNKKRILSDLLKKMNLQELELVRELGIDLTKVAQ